MKKIFKTFALLLGSGTCIANCPKTQAQNFTLPEDPVAETQQQDFNENALSALQNLDEMYFL